MVRRSLVEKGFPFAQSYVHCTRNYNFLIIIGYLLYPLIIIIVNIINLI